MKYSDLINPEYIIPSESNIHETYSLNRSFSPFSMFINFLPWSIRPRSYSKIANNWKARISIYPEDIEKAWEIIFPILHKKIPISR